MVVDGEEEEYSASGNKRAREKMERDEARGEGSWDSVGTPKSRTNDFRLSGSTSGSKMSTCVIPLRHADPGNVASRFHQVGSSIAREGKGVEQMDLVLGQEGSFSQMGPNISPRKFFRARRTPQKNPRLVAQFVWMDPTLLKCLRMMTRRTNGLL